MFDAIILSDLHLGSSNCLAKSLCKLLDGFAENNPSIAKLILNGDVFDSFDFRRLKKSHWKVLSLLRRLSDKMEIIWICGNHDGSAEIVSHLLGVTVKDEYVLASGGERILILHGHVFDDFLDKHPILTWLGDVIYWLLQRIDRTHYFAKLAKRGSKTFLRCARKIEERSIEYARKKHCTAVCCGHTHQPKCSLNQQVAYYNGGCWTESPGTYLSIAEGKVQLHNFEPEPAEHPAEVIAAPLLTLVLDPADRGNSQATGSLTARKAVL